MTIQERNKENTMSNEIKNQNGTPAAQPTKTLNPHEVQQL